MKITFVLPPVSMAGGVRVVAIYAQKLSERGHDVAVVSIPGVDKRSLRWRRALGLAPKLLPPRSSHLDGVDVNHRILADHRAVTDSDMPDADVVVATWWETAEWVAALSHSKGAKAYFVQHHEVWRSLPQDRTRATYRLPLHKIVVAQWLVDTMATEYGDRDVDLARNSVDQSQFFASPRRKQMRPTVGFMFAGNYFKGVDIALAAIRRLRQRIPELQVVCFGSSPLPKGAETGISFTLSPPQAEIRNLYAQCDVWLTASRSEGFNLPAMEAMACRTPVVSTRTGWPMEAIVDGVNGELVDIEDAPALADAAYRILTLEDVHWRALSEGAFRTVESCSWDRATDDFECGLRRAIARRDAFADGSR